MKALPRLFKAAKTADALTKVFAVPAALLTLVIGGTSLWKPAQDTLQLQRISSLRDVKAILDEAQEVNNHAIAFTDQLQSGKLSAVLEQLDQPFNGARVFYSKELNEYRIVHNFYERLGAYIELGYLDFDLVFQVIAFPDDFWLKTHPMASKIASSWAESHPILSDFRFNFDRLKVRYEKARAEMARVNDKKQP